MESIVKDLEKLVIEAKRRIDEASQNLQKIINEAGIERIIQDARKALEEAIKKIEAGPGRG